MLAGLHWPKHQVNANIEGPRYSPMSFRWFPDYRKPYDAREVIVRLADRSEFVEFDTYGSEILTAHATIDAVRLASLRTMVRSSRTVQ